MVKKTNKQTKKKKTISRPVKIMENSDHSVHLFSYLHATITEFGGSAAERIKSPAPDVFSICPFPTCRKRLAILLVVARVILIHGP